MNCKLNEKAISEFKDLYLQEYGIDIADSDALEMANSLLALIELMLRKKAQDEK